MSVKNITLSAEERLIQTARQKAMREKKSLNAVFREWLVRYAGNVTTAENYRELMKKLRHVKAGRHFTRDELNER